MQDKMYAIICYLGGSIVSLLEALPVKAERDLVLLQALRDFRKSIEEEVE